MSKPGKIPPPRTERGGEPPDVRRAFQRSQQENLQGDGLKRDRTGREEVRLDAESVLEANRRGLRMRLAQAFRRSRDGELELEPQAATAALNLFHARAKGLVPASGGGVEKFLRADGVWAEPSGSASLVDGDRGDVTVSGGGTVWLLNPDVLALIDLSDVDTTGAVATDVLTFDGSEWVPGPAAATALADGDYGDIVVSVGGTVFTIDANSVSLTKLADMPANRLIGRVSVGVGDPEVLTAAQVKAILAYVLSDIATDAQVLTAVKNVDGAGSGLDADLLDGFAHRGVGGVAEHPDATTGTSGFLSAADKTKLDGIETGATADLTGPEILALLAPVDGTGSGLDADTLDGFAHRGVGGSAEHPDATGATSGFMSAADKTILDLLATLALTHPQVMSRVHFGRAF